MSGRRRAQVDEDARLLGQTRLHLRGRRVPGARRRGALADRRADARRAARSPSRSSAPGAPALLLEHYRGRLEYHEPWHLNREVSHLFRGLVDAFEADELLAEHGHDDLRLVDNGVVNRRSRDARRAAARARLPPRAGERLEGRARSRCTCARAATRASEAFAVGDSREDLACAEHVGTFWLVANAVERDPSIREAIAASRRTCASPRRATARASTRRSSAR